MKNSVMIIFSTTALAVLLSACSSTLSDAVRARLEKEPALGAYAINIQNQRDSVTLSGVAGSYETKERILRTVHDVRRVKDVVDNIDVDTSLSLAGADSPTAREVLSAVKADRRLAPYSVTVKVQGGTAYLSGSASNEEDIDRIIDIANSQPPVTRVVSTLTVLPPPTDEEIRQQLTRLTRSAETPKISDLRIEVRDGSITLEGRAARFQDVDKILADINMISGVRSVENRITVKNQPYMESWKPKSGNS